MGSPEPVAKDPRVQALIEAYRRTLRNESASSAPTSAETSGDEHLLAERPPHWAPKSRLVRRPAQASRPAADAADDADRADTDRADEDESDS